MKRRAARIDKNQNELVDVLREMGATVAITSAIGNGFPDLVASYKDTNYLIEVKNGKLSPSKRRLTECEQKFHDAWQAPIHIFESVDQAIEFMNKLRVGDK